jgi:hypothetical protein
MRQLTAAIGRFGSFPTFSLTRSDVRYYPDTVAKVVLHWWSKIPRAADAIFM